MAPTRVALVFDDGYARSLERLIPLYEARGLPATLACVAAPERSPFAGSAAGWDVLTDLHRRSHRIHPHGWDHANLAQLPEAEAAVQIDRCLDIFAAQGIPVAGSTFHYPYNFGTPALHRHLLRRVAAVRVGGDGLMDATTVASRIWHCTGAGPDACDAHQLAALDRAARERPAAAILICHGLDGEGWGPISTATVEHLLDRISSDPALAHWDAKAGSLEDIA